MKKCSAFINGSCVNGYPDNITSRCGVCYGRDHGLYWTPCTSEGFFNEFHYPETGSPLTERAHNKGHQHG